MRAFVTCDLGYGGSGKGSTVDYICRMVRNRDVVRYNGGATSTCRVVLPEGGQHTFHQFGSGTLAGARTLLSEYVTVYPHVLLREALILQQEMGIQKPLNLLKIDGRANVTTPYHHALNRIKDIVTGSQNNLRRLGAGETVDYWLKDPSSALKMRDLKDPNVLEDKLEALRGKIGGEVETLLEGVQHVGEELRGELSIITEDKEFYGLLDYYKEFAASVHIQSPSQFLSQIGDNTVFEASHGVLLDAWYGFHPYTSPFSCTVANAEAIMRDTGKKWDTTKVGIIKAYSTRESPGPFLADNKAHDNTLGVRRGCFDLVATKYALKAAGTTFDYLAVTGLDCLPSPEEQKVLPVCNNYHTGEIYYQQLNVSPVPDICFQSALTEMLQNSTPSIENIPRREYLPIILENLKVSAGIVSYGPTWKDKHHGNYVPIKQ